jgi:phage tail protein X
VGLNDWLSWRVARHVRAGRERCLGLLPLSVVGAVLRTGGHATWSLRRAHRTDRADPRPGTHRANARGIVGALDVEWVHVAWNLWVLVIVVVLLVRFRDARWLWLTFALAGWHAAEHVYIVSTYMATVIAGTPGLAAQGGALGGGFPISRPDLHFTYNLVETAPLLLASLQQVKHQQFAQVRALRTTAPMVRASAP